MFFPSRMAENDAHKRGGILDDVIYIRGCFDSRIVTLASQLTQDELLVNRHLNKNPQTLDFREAKFTPLKQQAEQLWAKQHCVEGIAAPQAPGGPPASCT